MPRRRSFATTLTWIVLALQGALLLTLVVDQSGPPELGLTLLEDLWALAHKPSFYPLVGMIVVGLPASWLAVTQRGPHRVLLLVGWIGFTAAIAQWHWHRVSVMLRVLWEHGPQNF